MRDPFATAPEQEDEDLWLISYADLLTLLIAFFVVALAGATTRSNLLERAAEAFGGGREDSLGTLRSELDALIAEEALGSARTVEDARGVGIVLGDALLFDPGSDALRPDAVAWLERVATRLAPMTRRTVTVEGHTDDVPIRNARHASNWELSAGRALSVVHALERAGIPRGRLAAESYADTRPAITDGPIEDRRAANRRVVIRVE